MAVTCPRVFVIDDEPVIAKTLTAILRINGFTVTSFTDPLAALNLVVSEAPDLVISDVVMPRLSGIDLALQIKTLRPECRILLISGQANTVSFSEEASRMDCHFRILPKPIHPVELLKAISEQSFVS